MREGYEYDYVYDWLLQPANSRYIDKVPMGLNILQDMDNGKKLNKLDPKVLKNETKEGDDDGEYSETDSSNPEKELARKKAAEKKKALPKEKLITENHSSFMEHQQQQLKLKPIPIQTHVAVGQTSSPPVVSPKGHAQKPKKDNCMIF